MTTIEHKNICSRGGGGGAGFNQVLIQVQLIHSLPFACDYDEENEKKRYPTQFLTRAALKASCVTTDSKKYVYQISHSSYMIASNNDFHNTKKTP